MDTLFREIELGNEMSLIRAALEKIITVVQPQFEERLVVMEHPYDPHDLFGKKARDKGLCIFKIETEQHQMDTPPFFIVGPYGETILVVLTDVIMSTGKVSVSVHDPRLVESARTYLGEVIQALGMSDVVFVKNFAR